MKLDDEIVKLVKSISAAVMKDATPDDLVVMSLQQHSSGTATESHTEFSRLRRLPGFSRLQRQLFYNLMTSRPDVSDNNIRIENVEKVRQPKTTSGGAADAVSPRNKSAADSLVFTAAADFNKESDRMEEAMQLDRATIKSISNLILDRNHAKMSSKSSAFKRKPY